MRTVRAAVVVVAMLALPSAMTGPSAKAVMPNGDGVRAQADLDRSASAQDPSGLWGDAVGGVNGRPYVTDLAVTVTPVGGAPITRTYVAAGSVTTPASGTQGDLVAVISPYNLCNRAKGETESPGRCYSSPNRLGAMIGYVKGAGQIGSNFSNPTTSNGQPLSSPVLDAIKAQGSVTTFDVKINMNTWGSSLRWTWINGKPTYWNVSSLGEAASVVHLRFEIVTGPDVQCDTRIPVEGCDPAARYTPQTPPDRILKTDLVFSLDNTGVDQVFAGSLFASSNADMGSLEAAPVGSETPGLTYGISGPNELSGTAAVADFWAMVSDSTLMRYFGVDQTTLDSAEFKDSETLRVQRRDGGTTGSQGWTRWSSATNGTAGYFFSATGIAFDGAQVRSAALRRSFAAKFTVGRRITSKARVARAGSRQRLTLSSTSPECRSGQCRWVVSRLGSGSPASMKRIATVPARRGSASSLVTARKGDRLSVVLQVKRGGKWRFVTSRLVVAR